MFSTDARGFMRFVTWVTMVCIVFVLVNHSGAWTGLSDLANTASWVAACGVALLVFGALMGTSADCCYGMVVPCVLTALVLGGGDQLKVVAFAACAAVLGGTYLAAKLPTPLANMVPDGLKVRPQH